MQQRYAALVQHLREAVLRSPGETDAALRTSVQACAAAHADGAGSNGARVPVALRSYVDMVARHAYRITDADVHALKRAGYSENAIFEITVTAAVGAGLYRLERGLAALQRVD